LNKLHNGRLAALFLEVTHAESFRKELECTFVFDGDEVQMSLISPWEKFIAYRERKFKCPVGVAYLPVPALWKAVSTIPMDKKLGQWK